MKEEFEVKVLDPCPMCDSDGIIESMQEDVFHFGDEQAEISVTIPVLSCSSCGFSFTDHRAEVIRHAAVCKHQGLLAPDEIRCIRQNLAMSQREFSAAFGIPRASMDRWENGKLFQNASLDTLLRALANPGIAARLDRRRRKRDVPIHNNVVAFPTLQQTEAVFENAKVREAQFTLRACG